MCGMEHGSLSDEEAYTTYPIGVNPLWDSRGHPIFCAKFYSHISNTVGSLVQRSDWRYLSLWRYIILPSGELSRNHYLSL